MFTIDREDYFSILDHLNEEAKRVGSTKKAQLDYTSGKAVLEMPESWHWMDVGRRPGQPPPFDVIYDWVLERQISRGTEAVRIAWAITKEIAKTGIKGKQWLDEAIETAADIFRVVILTKTDKEFKSKWMKKYI